VAEGVDTLEKALETACETFLGLYSGHVNPPTATFRSCSTVLGSIADSKNQYQLVDKSKSAEAVEVRTAFTCVSNIGLF
jgi:hypothetical protein